MEEDQLEQKIKDLKEFVKLKTDLGTANYVGQQIREICGIVETICSIKTQDERKN